LETGCVSKPKIIYPGSTFNRLFADFRW